MVNVFISRRGTLSFADFNVICNSKMTDISIKYYCDESLKNNDQDKWVFLLDYAFNKADQVEFNILYSENGLTKILTDLSDDFIEKGKRKEKIYRHGQFIRYNLSDKMKSFIKSKKYSDWYTFFFEDISFLKEGKEFFATITHENFIIIQLTEGERNYLNNNGFHFDSDWGTSPASLTENLEEMVKSLLDKLKGLFKTRR